MKKDTALSYWGPYALLFVFTFSSAVSVAEEYSLELEHKARASQRAEYISRHPKISSKTRSAILAGKVILGMTPEEAIAAGGNYAWTTSGDALRQLTFNNLSQFETSKPTGFTAVFEKGLVVKIDRLNDLDACKDFDSKGAPITWKDAPYPYAGFWMENCEDGFGLRFFPAGGGRYAIRFCGPGGHGKDAPSDCTVIPSEPKYVVVDPNTVTITNSLGRETYKRCKP